MTTPQIEPISPEEARQHLEEAMATYLEDGWIVRAEHDYMARLTRGKRNLDFYVDLLGNVTMEDKALTPGQDSGRLVAWLLLLATFLVVLAFASAVGWI
jgi:hypothetical protein